MTDYEASAFERWQLCERIAAHARRQGLDATARKVNRRFDVWRRWYEGRYPTGYLIRQTGVRYRERG